MNVADNGLPSRNRGRNVTTRLIVLRRSVHDRPVLTRAELHACGPAAARRLAHLPTPLEEAPRFAGAVGGGPRLHQARRLHRPAVRRQQGPAQRVPPGRRPATRAATWSSGAPASSRTTAGRRPPRVRKLGLECRLYLSRATQHGRCRATCCSTTWSGRTVEFVDAAIGPELDAPAGRRRRRSCAAQGRKPYVWHPPRTVPLAAVSYALCLAEIAEQLREPGVEPAAVYVSSSGATGAGAGAGPGGCWA